jgi:hypothetical protein
MVGSDELEHYQRFPPSFLKVDFGFTIYELVEAFERQLVRKS